MDTLSKESPGQGEGKPASRSGWRIGWTAGQEPRPADPGGGYDPSSQSPESQISKPQDVPLKKISESGVEGHEPIRSYCHSASLAPGPRPQRSGRRPPGHRLPLDRPGGPGAAALLTALRL